MREIKFRFWDKSRKKFTDYGAIHIDGDIMTRSTTFGGMYDFVSEEQSENIVIQQYTGLKDKSGVEIYEGDILTVSIGLTDRINATQVLYEFGAFVLDVPNFVSNPYLGDYIENLNFEVIGNIYENPELLKSGNNG